MKHSTQQSPTLSDKDLQLLKKTYIRLTELFYESKNESASRDLIVMGDLIRQSISTKREADTLSVLSIMEILKVKGRASPALVKSVEPVIAHLKQPSLQPIGYS